MTKEKKIISGKHATQAGSRDLKSGPGNNLSTTEHHTDKSVSGKKILIVDIDLLSILNISQALLRSGYVLSHAMDALQAVRAVKEERPDLIICGYDDGNPDTLQLAKSVHQSMGSLRIPFLFVLEAQCDSTQAPQILGPRMYLTKPFTHEQLSLAVLEQIGFRSERSFG
jgi:CheY-like chemotaxis protein